ncbi:hypothetical protein [Candidatus Leptofilum sp.]|uniref:hypothetical protein n=1 Tax=Candidatus Leptofilum sp. TaxID=3241576 RepID=UPI003B58EF40
MSADPKLLYAALNQKYSKSELRKLAFELDIDYEDIEGQNKSAKVLALVQYAQRHSRLEEIAAYIRRSRPDEKLKPKLTAQTSLEDANQSDSGRVTHIYQAPVYQGDIGNLATEGGTATDSRKKIEVKADNIIGNIGDGEFRNEGNIAMGDIVLGDQPLPQTKEEFIKQLKTLQDLLNEAVSQGEFDKERDGTKVVAAADEIAEEIAEEEPDKITILTRLKELKTRLENIASVVEAAGKTGKAILKAAPIVGALIKLAQIVF